LPAIRYLAGLLKIKVPGSGRLFSMVSKPLGSQNGEYLNASIIVGMECSQINKQIRQFFPDFNSVSVAAIAATPPEARAHRRENQL
jgi:hypothetical protein